MLETKRESGFTLVELLIVAIILAVLAAIVVPQFTTSTVGAKEAALRANLSTIRTAIDLYQQQHASLPGSSASSGGTCSATSGTGAAQSANAVVEQLTRYSNLDGQTCSAPEAGFIFGPYLRDDDFPANPVTGNRAIVVSDSGDLNLRAPDVGQGWHYDVVNGKFIANDTGSDSSGNAYDSY